MNREYGEYKGIEYIRINKTQARKNYIAGYKQLVLPVNVRLGNSWIEPLILSKKELIHPEDDFNMFDSRISEYEYYNCNYNDLGYYPKYYISLKDYHEIWGLDEYSDRVPF